MKKLKTYLKCSSFSLRPPAVEQSKQHFIVYMLSISDVMSNLLLLQGCVLPCEEETLFSEKFVLIFTFQLKTMTPVKDNDNRVIGWLYLQSLYIKGANIFWSILSSGIMNLYFWCWKKNISAARYQTPGLTNGDLLPLFLQWMSVGTGGFFPSVILYFPWLFSSGGDFGRVWEENS